jgi:hypothetical protein
MPRIERSEPIALNSDTTNHRTTPIFDTIETAAAKLDVPPDSLRARCRRAAKSAGDASVASLGGGIVAFRFGRSWRIRFPQF